MTKPYSEKIDQITALRVGKVAKCWLPHQRYIATEMLAFNEIFINGCSGNFQNVQLMKKIRQYDDSSVSAQ